MSEIQPHIREITKAMIKSAKKPTSAGTADRRLILQSVGLLDRDNKKNEQPSMGDILSKLFSNHAARHAQKLTTTQ